MISVRSVQKAALLAALFAGGAGCSSLTAHNAQGPSCGGEDKKCHIDPEAKTLLGWGICKEPEQNKDEKNGNGEKKDEPQVGYTTAPDGQLVPVALLADAPAKDGKEAERNGNGESGNGKNGDAKSAAAPEEDKIKTDRPDFTEASSTVGKGRIQIEAGYTFFTDRAGGVRTNAHSYPEVLIRTGVLADWFELRFGQNVSTTRTSGPSLQGQVPGVRDTVRASGTEDLYIGTKTALTEQKGFLPETALILQATVPTGSDEFTTNKFLPGISFLFSWELSEKWSLAGSVLMNKAVTGEGRSYYEFANSLSIGRSLTDRLASYFEYFAFYPSGASSPDVTPQYFLNGGFTYLITNTIQFDIRAGLGLNRAASDFFVGSGLAIKF